MRHRRSGGDRHDRSGREEPRRVRVDLARQCLEQGLLDEFHVHLAPVMLGDGIRLLDAPGTNPVRWERILDPDSGAQVLDLRYWPV